MSRGVSVLRAAFKEMGYRNVLEKQAVQENLDLERVSRFSLKYLLFVKVLCLLLFGKI